MKAKAPGKSCRKGISLVELMRKFPDDETVGAWIAGQCWLNGVDTPDTAVCNERRRRVLESISFNHVMAKRSLSEYVKGDAHTNGIESLCSMLKHTHKDAFHRLDPKHYVQEFAGRHNICEQDTYEQMLTMRRGMGGKHFCCREPFAANGLNSGARS